MMKRRRWRTSVYAAGALVALLAATVWALVSRPDTHEGVESIQEIYKDYLGTEYNCLANCHQRETLLGGKYQRQEGKGQLASILEGGGQEEFPPPTFSRNPDGTYSFEKKGAIYDYYDGWYRVAGTLNKSAFGEGDTIRADIHLTVYSGQLEPVLARADRVVAAMVAYRMYDAGGIYRQQADELMSTVLTPTGLPIESGPPQFPSSITGAAFRTPLDAVAFIDNPRTSSNSDIFRADFVLTGIVDDEFPAGLYRFQVQFFIETGDETVPFFVAPGLWASGENKAPFELCRYGFVWRDILSLPLVRVHDPGPPKMIWTLFSDRFSFGTQGIVAEEDRNHFAFNSRINFQSRLVLPRGTIAVLEPDFPTVAPFRLPGIGFQATAFHEEFPLNYGSGMLSVRVKGPNGEMVDLGSSSFSHRGGLGARTRTDTFRHSFDTWGNYQISMRGWIEDVWGNRHHGGGTYDFWVANRLSFSTSVKPGTPFLVGGTYPASVTVNPPCPADVKLEILFFPDSNPDEKRRVTLSGKASRYGYFVPDRDQTSMYFDTPGEYVSDIYASYVDSDGELWVGSERSGGIVAPPDSTLVAHGLKVPSAHDSDRFVARYDSKREGGEWAFGKSTVYAWHNDPVMHIAGFPFLTGDVLSVATNSFYNGEYASSNQVGLVLSMEDRSEEIRPEGAPSAILGIPQPNWSELPKSGPGKFFARTLRRVFYHHWLGESILNTRRDPQSMRLESDTSNGYVPHNFPEYITRLSYFYATAIRPGFLVNTVVSESAFPHAYWITGPFPGGGQYGSMERNGDLPTDTYWYTGGVVVRDLEKGTSRYAAYSSMCVIMPKGHNANRVVAPGTEPLLEINGRKHSIFLAGAPSGGNIYEVGQRTGTGSLIFPCVTADVRVVITDPDGLETLFSGSGNRLGIYGGGIYTFAKPGVHRVHPEGRFNGRRGDVLGSGDGIYNVYCVESDAEDLIEMEVDKRAEVITDRTYLFRGHIRRPLRDGHVVYTIVMPGVVMDEGVVPVVNGRFAVPFNPVDFGIEYPNYDIYRYPNSERNPDSQSQSLWDTVVVTFFLEGRDGKGEALHSAKRIVIRGDRIDIL